jgi:metal-responsive CopG/Arc/MetJ family transcriptional regulator
MKVAISIPDDVFELGERVSQRLRVSRSRLYADAVQAYAREHSGDDVTRQLDAVYSKESIEVDGGLEEGALEVLRQEKW